MKRLITLTMLSVLLAIGVTGCAHNYLQRVNKKEAVITGVMVIGVVLMAATHTCENCNFDSAGAVQR